MSSKIHQNSTYWSIVILCQDQSKIAVGIKILFGCAALHNMPPPTGQEFFKDFCEDETFIVQRRKVLRLRAGLTDAEKHKVGTLVSFIQKK